uniref:Uncharacterized protein n=1 Tax=Parascaris univalens TaxID=6257 RepID=A0A915ALZ9_PARUN
MRFANLKLNSTIGSGIVVGFASLDELSPDDAFDLLFAECLKGKNPSREIVWYRDERPSRIPMDCRPTVAQLSCIHLRYSHGQMIAAITSFCANIHCSKQVDLLIVEFLESDIPHEASCAALLALLSDAARWIQQHRQVAIDDGNAEDLPSLVALIRPNNMFDHLMITSLYTDCIVLIESKSVFVDALDG